MAFKRLANLRTLRQNFPSFISFFVGILFCLVFLCSKTKRFDEMPQKTTRKTTQGPLATTRPQLKTTLKTTDFIRLRTTATPPPLPTIIPYPPIISKKGLLITPKFTCPKNLMLLIVVVSSSRNFHARKAIRTSWGSNLSKKNNTLESFRVVYSLGVDGHNDRLIAREAKRYGDILRGGFEDVYRQDESHTVKLLFALKWMTSSCQSKFVLKVSSESFVNVPQILSFLGKKEATRKSHALYTGFCHGNNVGGARVVRNPKSMWFISKDEWPEQRLPPYASGMGFIVSHDVAERTVKMSLKVLYFNYMLYAAIAINC